MRNIVKLVPILFLVSIFILEDLKAQRTSRRSQTDTTSVTTPSRTSTSGRRSTDDSGSSSARTGSSGRTTRNNDATSGRTTNRNSGANSGRTTRAGGRDAGAAKTSSDISGSFYGPYVFYSDLTDAHTVVSNACSWSKFQTPTSPYKLHKRARGYGSLNSSKTSCSGRTKKGRSQTKTSGFYILVADNLDAAGYKLGSGNVFEEIEAAASATISGCMDASADNYDSAATEDDGSCTYPAAVTVVSGCMDSSADNYNSAATEDDGSCTYPAAVTVVSGCMDSSADNYDSAATVDNGSCTYAVQGCMNTYANNYDASATVDDGSCSFTFCDNPRASNYGQNASGVNIFGNFWQYRENWSGVHVSVVSEGCIYKGCMDNAADNYDYAATEDDGSCIYDD